MINNSISISISDEPFRHRRRKPVRTGRSAPLRRFVKSASMRWPLLFLPAFVWIFFQASKLARAPPDSNRVTAGKESVFSSEDRDSEESIGNLNRLEPVTRVVHGVRVPCLKIRSPDEIQNLEFPPPVDLNFSIKRIAYKSGQLCDEQDAKHLQEEHTRFNSFTGYPTLLEREQSFRVNESMEVYCGFYCEKGGFVISEKDKHYMRNCKAVVSTCAFGGGDDLYQPISMTNASLNKVCYVAFWDEITRLAQESERKLIGPDRKIGKWRIVVVSNLPFSDQRLNGKIPKMLSHRLFPEARYSIWVDSKSQFRRDPVGVLESLLWSNGSIFAISEHGARSNLYDEAKAIVKKNKATPEEVELQLNQYRTDNFPHDKRFNGKKALAEASIIVREHNAMTNHLMCVWFNEVVRFTSRDQLSFPYVLRRINLPRVNMFPVCTRKDMVNSMGHKRKVKPLLLGQT